MNNRKIFALILALVIFGIMRIKVLPTKAHTTKRLSSMNFDGEDVSKSAAFLAEIKKGGARTQAQYGGKKFGLMMDIRCFFATFGILNGKGVVEGGTGELHRREQK